MKDKRDGKMSSQQKAFIYSAVYYSIEFRSFVNDFKLDLNMVLMKNLCCFLFHTRRRLDCYFVVWEISLSAYCQHTEWPASWHCHCFYLSCISSTLHFYNNVHILTFHLTHQILMLKTFISVTVWDFDRCQGIWGNWPKVRELLEKI